jgi:hypothetical protein
MKMLTIEVFNVNRGPKTYIRIVDQPFIGCEFWCGEATFWASNGFRLHSRYHPEIRNVSCLNVRGISSLKDNVVLVAPDDCFIDMLAIAVREYNNYLEDSCGGQAFYQLNRILKRKTPDIGVVEALFDIQEVIK